MPPAKDHHQPQLDGVRAIAALLVLGFHLTTRYQELYAPDAGLAGLPARLGLPALFMLSGYLLPGVAARATDAGTFVLSRLWRLFPAYWACTTITMIVVVCFGLPGRGVTWGEFALNLTMLQKVLGVTPVDGATWTLQEELSLIAVLAGAVALRAARHTPWVLAGLVALCVVRADSPTWMPDLRWWSLFLMGMTLADSRRGWRPRHTLFLVLAAGEIVLREARPREGHPAWADASVPYLLATAGGFATLWAASRNRVPVLAAPVFRFIAGLSYPLYLLHQNIGFVVRREAEALGVGPWLAVGLAAAVALVLAWGVHTLVESPARRWWRERRAARDTVGACPTLPGSGLSP